MVLALDAQLGVSIDTGVNPWSDQVSVNHAAQSVGSKQPAFTTFGGLSIVDFDGIDDDMKNESLSSMGAVGASYTVFAVVKFDLVNSRGVFEFTDSSGDAVNKGLSLHASGTSLLFRAFDGTGFSDATVAFTDTTAAHIIECVHTTASRSIRVDGGTPATNAVSRSLVALQNYYLGRLGANIFRSDLRLHSLLAWKTELTSGQLTTVRTRLSERWGITLS